MRVYISVTFTSIKSGHGGGDIRNRDPGGWNVLETVWLCSSMPGVRGSQSCSPSSVCRGHHWPSPADSWRGHANMRWNMAPSHFSWSCDMSLVFNLKTLTHFTSRYLTFSFLKPHSLSPLALCPWLPRNLGQCFSNNMSRFQILHRSGPWLSLVIYPLLKQKEIMHGKTASKMPAPSMCPENVSFLPSPSQ